MYATPNYPYDRHSVWNRNQLGDLGSGTGTMILLAVAAYFGFKYLNKR